MPRPRPKKKTGGSRMKEMGYEPFQMWLDKEEKQILFNASVKDGRPLTRFVLRAALKEAKRILGLDP